MAHEMFTHEWAVSWGEQIRANLEYREAARSWRWSMVFIMWASPELGVPERSIFLDLFEGDCREARAALATDLEHAPYVISAAPATWKRVVDRELEPIPGLMRGTLKLERGSLASLLPYLRASKELVLSAARVNTCFPEGLAS